MLFTTWTLFLYMQKTAWTVLQTRFQLLPVAVRRLTNWTHENSKIHDNSIFSILAQLIFLVAGGASYLLGPRFGFLTVKGNCSTFISFLYIPVGSWTRNHLHFHHGYADEKRCTSHNVPSTVSNGCLNWCNKHHQHLVKTSRSCTYWYIHFIRQSRGPPWTICRRVGG